MTQPQTFTQQDLRFQVEQAIAGWAADYNVDGIVDSIQARFGTVPVDTIPDQDFWDIAADYHTADPGPVPPVPASDIELARRIRVIAAIHAVAQWLADHPDAPTPHTVEVRANPGLGYTSSDTQRVAAVDQFAAAHQATRLAISTSEYAKLALGTPDSHGAEITYTLATTRTGRVGAGANSNGHPCGCQCPLCGGR